MPAWLARNAARTPKQPVRPRPTPTPDFTDPVSPPQCFRTNDRGIREVFFAGRSPQGTGCGARPIGKALNPSFRSNSIAVLRASDGGVLSDDQMSHGRRRARRI